MKKNILLLCLLAVSFVNSQVFKLASGSSTTFLKKEGSSGWIDISNSMAMNHDMTVKFTLVGKNSSAIVSDDLSNLSSTSDTITFGPMATSRKFSFKTVLDGLTEGNDTFIFKLTQAVTMGTIGTPDSVMFIVTDSVSTTPNPTTPKSPYYTIGKVRGNNTGNIPDSNNVKCTLRGVLYGVNNSTSTTGYRFSLCDGTGCISMNSSKSYSNYSNAKEGDSVEIKGTVSHYNGLAQINFFSTGDSIILLGTKTISSSQIITTLDESTESKLVKLEKVQYVSGSWAANSEFDIKVKNSTGKEFSIRILNKSDKISATNLLVAGKTYNITGLGSQYSTSSTLGDGYQLVPRKSTDIVEATTGAITTSQVSIYTPIKVYPNPIVNNNFTIEFKTLSREPLNIQLVDLMGREAFATLYTPTLGLNKVKIEDISSINKGVYFLMLSNNNIQKMTKIIIE